MYAVPSLHLHMSGDTGWPDRVFFIDGGKPLIIEFKDVGEEPTPKQKLKHAILRYRGYDIQVHNNKTEALAAVVLAVANARNDGSARGGKRRA
jgi:hypothetical protein